MLLGAIADDLTGATDLCNTLVKNGMRVVQTTGVPTRPLPLDDVDCVVVALKTRSVASDDAIAQSLQALSFLQEGGARQIIFKYCSTFDSTDRGNIGPVAEALMDALDTTFTIYCPVFPENGRTLFNGYLFVGPVLLSESSLRNHPLNPMTDPNLVRVLDRQTAGTVGLVHFNTVRQGAEAIRAEFAELRSKGFRHAIVDAISVEDLVAIGHACDGLPLVTGGSGVAQGLPDVLRAQGLLSDSVESGALPKVDGPAVVLAGSCSDATLGQIAHMTARRPALALDPAVICAGDDQVETALAWAASRLGDDPILISVSRPAAEVRALQERFGREAAGAAIERTVASVAKALVDRHGVRRLVVAGGETSGAVMGALGVSALRIGAEIDPGVPWTTSLGAPTLALALKSGNFGGEDFFTRAFEALE